MNMPQKNSVEAAPGVLEGAPPVPGELMLLCEVGSTLHGIDTGSDDLDLMGICIGPRRAVTGTGSFEHLVWRTAAEGQRSQPGDVDLTVYSLHKWMKLAMAGNPSVILLLWAPQDKLEVVTDAAHELREDPLRIVSRQTGERFLGYLNGQRQRAIDDRGGHRGKREGRTAKWASHMVRLGLQGVELLSTGRLSLPMVGEDLELTRAVKTGELGLADALALADHSEHLIRDLLEEGCALPDEPDVAWIDDWMHRTYLESWDGQAVD